MTPRIVDLDALVGDQRVKVGGVEYPVKAASAKVARLAKSVTEETHLDVLPQMVRMVCPTLPAEVLDELTALQLETIIQVSAEGIVVVQDADPNVERPVTETSLPA